MSSMSARRVNFTFFFFTKLQRNLCVRVLLPMLCSVILQMRINNNLSIMQKALCCAEGFLFIDYLAGS